MAAIRIRHRVGNITQQVDSNDCWAACTAMVMGRHSNAGLEHVKNLAKAAGVPLDEGTLPESSIPALARAVHLRYWVFQGARIVTLPVLAQAMKFGPVVAFGEFNYPNVVNPFKHAVAIYALEGDGSARKTNISLMDPSSTKNPFVDDWEDFDDNVAADINFLLSR